MSPNPPWLRGICVHLRWGIFGIHGTANDLGFELFKEGYFIGKGRNFRGADKGKVQGIEKQDFPFSLEIGKGNGLDILSPNGITREGWCGLSDESLVCYFVIHDVLLVVITNSTVDDCKSKRPLFQAKQWGNEIFRPHPLILGSYGVKKTCKGKNTLQQLKIMMLRVEKFHNKRRFLHVQGYGGQLPTLYY